MTKRYADHLKKYNKGAMAGEKLWDAKGTMGNVGSQSLSGLIDKIKEKRSEEVGICDKRLTPQSTSEYAAFEQRYESVDKFRRKYNEKIDGINKERADFRIKRDFFKKEMEAFKEQGQSTLGYLLGVK